MNSKLFTKGKQLLNFIVYSNMSTKLPGAKLQEVVSKLENFAPKSLSEKWDNTGVLVEPYTPRVIYNILLTNDLTEDVMDEAVRCDTQLIISYHPPIFSGMKRITNSTWKERLVSRCLEKQIAIYSPHTSWDAVKGGVNDWLTKCLPENTKNFISEGATPESGLGRICEIKKPILLMDLLQMVKSHTNIEHLQLALGRGCSVTNNVSTVAFCAGSGSSVLKGVKADVYLTGEMSHHDVLDAVHNGTSVILTNHSNSERGYLKEFRGELLKMLNNHVNIVVSEADQDPLKTV